MPLELPLTCPQHYFDWFDQNQHPKPEVPKPQPRSSVDGDLSQRFTSGSTKSSTLPSPGNHRSALHTGDFTEPICIPLHKFSASPKPNTDRVSVTQSTRPLGSSPTTPWFRPESLRVDTSFPSATSGNAVTTTTRARSRAPSLHSFSSSFILKQPTSPLVQQSNNDDPESSTVDGTDRGNRQDKRHSLQALPQSFSSTFTTLAQAARQPQVLQREGTFSTPLHQPTRSITSVFPSQLSTSPHTPPFLRSRRTSCSSDASPLQHASMVGSYEESILRGRMSTTPSIPLNFTAQIGALGKDDCKPKCPPHVTVEFPAVYYNWSDSSHQSINDEPSPYVGLIDLEHQLSPPTRREKRHRRRASPESKGHDSRNSSPLRTSSRNRDKRKRRSSSPEDSRVPMGGCYRIPQRGHLQILIKNPNKTVVKLFLVPYDFHDMEPGTKTFIRQRCYSSGPMIEEPTIPFSSPTPSKPTITKTKQTVRYLVQLNICCPSRGRYYLYKSIRVIFANRVPDNKEMLQNENIWPEPRYSPYKPSVENRASSIDLKNMSDKAHRRRSYGFDGTSVFRSGSMPEATMSRSHHARSISSHHSAIPPVPSIPFHLLPSNKFPKIQTSKDNDDIDPMDLDSTNPAGPELESPINDKLARLSATHLAAPDSGMARGVDGFNKLSRGESGLFGRPRTPEPGEGLLAQGLRKL